jgi:hypothetical protein
MASEQRDLEKQLEDLGYEHARKTGSGHQVYRHPLAGTLIVPSSIGRGRGGANLLSVAKRNLRQARSNAGHFIDFLCELYEVPRDGKRTIRLNVSEEIRNWRESEPGGDRINSSSVMTTVRQHPQVTILPKPEGARISLWEITGKDYVPEEIQEEEPMPAVAELHRAEPAAPSLDGAPEEMFAALSQAVSELTKQTELQSKIEVAISAFEGIRKQADDILSLLQSR